MGLTLLSDSNSADISNIVPTMIPQYDRILGGGILIVGTILLISAELLSDNRVKPISLPKSMVL
jgi:hypothetical protein